MAFGRNATADHNGAIVFGDNSFTSVSSSNADEMRIQHDFYAASTNTASARSQKIDIDPVDPGAVLDGVEDLEVSRWTYEWDDDSEDDDPPRHLGPMAGDFYETFGVGNDDEHITTVDADGVALAAIQGLSEKVESESDDLRADLAAKDERIDDLERKADRVDDLAAENERLRERNRALEARLEAVETRVGIEPAGTVVD